MDVIPLLRDAVVSIEAVRERLAVLVRSVVAEHVAVGGALE
jgi:hypothetical protein